MLRPLTFQLVLDKIRLELVQLLSDMGRLQ